MIYFPLKFEIICRACQRKLVPIISMKNNVTQRRHRYHKPDEELFRLLMKKYSSLKTALSKVNKTQLKNGLHQETVKENIMK